MNKKLVSITFAVFLFLAVVTSTVQVSHSLTWSTDIRLTSDPTEDLDPAITQMSDGKIWVTWHSWRTGNYEIFYKISDGSSWSSDIQLTHDVRRDLHPSILQSLDGKIWIVWDSNRTGNDDIYYKTSVNNGASWSDDIRFTTDPTRDHCPSIMQSSDGKIWVFWSSGRNVTVTPPDPTYVPTANIFYKFSSDSGQTWSADTLLVTDFKNNYWDDLYPSAMQAVNSSIWVVWAKEAKNIYYTIYNGTGWSRGLNITSPSTAQNTHPFIMQTANGRIWVFWDSNIPATDENIYYKIFDGSWSNNIQLTTALEDDEWPSAVQANDLAIWVTWSSPRYPQLFYDVFYKTGIELHDVAVRRVTPSTFHHSNTLAYRGEIARFEVEVENQGEGREIFEVKAYANSTYVGSKIVSLDFGKTYVLIFEWNTSKVKPGMYIPKAIATAVQGESDTSDNTMTGASFEVRIKGDFCGWYGGVLKPIPDRLVDIDDFGMAVGYFGTSSPTWHPIWGPACDVNEDGLVDLEDIMIIGANYLQT